MLVVQGIFPLSRGDRWVMKERICSLWLQEAELGS